MLNSVAVMGRLTATPERKTTASGVAVTTFTVAVQRAYVKRGEERQTDFIDCVAWRNTAEFICRNFQKGKMIVLDGSLQTRIYNDRNGNSRKATEIVVRDAFFVQREHSESNEFDQTTRYSEEDFSQISPDDEDLPF